MMINNKRIEEYLEYWLMKFIDCKDIEGKISAGSLLTYVLHQRVKHRNVDKDKCQLCPGPFKMSTCEQEEDGWGQSRMIRAIIPIDSNSYREMKDLEGSSRMGTCGGVLSSFQKDELMGCCCLSCFYLLFFYWCQVMCNRSIKMWWKIKTITPPPSLRLCPPLTPLPLPPTLSVLSLLGICCTLSTAAELISVFLLSAETLWGVWADIFLSIGIFSRWIRPQVGSIW